MTVQERKPNELAIEQLISFPNAIYVNERPTAAKPNRPDNELSKNEFRVEFIELTPEGLITRYKDEPHKWRGYPHRTHIWAVCEVKKAILCVLRVIVSAPYLIPFLWLAKKPLIWNFEKWVNNVFYYFYFKPQYYQRGGREMARAGEKLGFHYDLYMILVMIYEWDDAYRNRIQVIFTNLDKSKLSENPRKELRRICDFMIENERTEVREKWKVFKKALLFLPPKYVRMIKNFLLEIDINKMVMDEDELWWARRKADFNIDSYV